MEVFDKIQSYKRMLETARKFWKLKEREMVNLDPAIKMLMGGAAKEFEKLGQELENAEQRIIDRMADFFLPDADLDIVPAHGILQAYPHETQLTISPYMHWRTSYTKRKRANAPEETFNVFFSPAGFVDLSKPRVKYISNTRKLWCVDDQNEKYEITKGDSEENNCLWLGLTQIETLPESLCFYLKQDKSQWTASQIRNSYELINVCNSREAEVNSQKGRKQKQSLKIDLDDLYSKLRQLEKKIEAFYKPMFLSVDTEGLEQGLPESLSHFQHELDEDEILWVKLVFPTRVSQAFIDDIIPLTNCFPVINRNYERRNVRLSNGVNIKSLRSEGHFLELDSVITQEDMEYVEAPSLDFQDVKKGAFMIRRKGMGRFDRRDAEELISHTLDQVRDELAAFSSMEVDTISSELKSISASLQKIYRNLPEDISNSSEPYIIIKPAKRNEVVEISFWTVSGIDDDELMGLDVLSSTDPHAFEGGNGRLVTTPIGQKLTESNVERVQRLRSSLLSRGRIVTLKDIEMKAHEVFGGEAKKVEVSKGVSVSSDHDKGLVRSIKIEVQPTPSLKRDEQMWSYFCHELEYAIENNSSIITPVTIEMI